MRDNRRYHRAILRANNLSGVNSRDDVLTILFNKIKEIKATKQPTNKSIEINKQSNMTFSQEINSEMKKQKELLLNSDADLQNEATVRVSDEKKNIHATNKSIGESPTKRFPFQFIPLQRSGSHRPSEGSRYLMKHEVTLEDLTVLTEKFYELAFLDSRLDKFIRSHSDPHGTRFAAWIHQKLSGSNVWDQDRASRGRGCPVHDRTSAHVAAWYSPKRPAEERGEHFQLDDCRVWMRLHFWALRESGLMEKSPSFSDYYVRFIAHFVRVYESTAPAFARESLKWSQDPKNIEEYIQNGRKMTDVFGLNYYGAAHQIPENELNDEEWPYNQAPRS